MPNSFTVFPSKGQLKMQFKPDCSGYSAQLDELRGLGFGLATRKETIQTVALASYQ